MPLKALTTHVSLFGTSGSGKTGFLLNIVEQVLQNKVPVCLCDIKGDLINIIQSELRDKLDITVITPGSNTGNTINIFGRITEPNQSDSIIKCLLTMIGIDSSKTTSPYHSYLATLIREQFLNQDIELEELLDAVMHPKIKNLGMFDINEIFPAKARKELAFKLNNIIANPSYSLWRNGITLDFNELFKSKEGKTPLVIISVSHIIDESERIAALAAVFTEYLHWTMSLSGSPELRSLLVVDESHGLMPPYPKNPVTKGPLLSLLKQARAFGNGVLLATQNPKDLDYKGLSNCGLWVSGKLQTKNDRERVLEGFLAVSSYDKRTLDNKLGSLQKREFLVAHNENMSILRSNNVKTPLQGPLSVHDLLVLRDKLGYYTIKEYQDKRTIMADLMNKYRRTGLIGFLKQYINVEGS